MRVRFRSSLARILFSTVALCLCLAILPAALPQAASAANQPPVAGDDSYSTPVNTTLIVPAPGVLVNDSDPDGDVITQIDVIAFPADGFTAIQVAGSNMGAFSFTPNTDFVGTGYMTYRVTDGQNWSNVATVTITVGAPSPPTAGAGGPYTVDEGSCVALTGSGADSQGLPLTYAWDLNGDGVFETPGQSVPYCAVDGPVTVPIALQVCNSEGLCATAGTTVTINNVAPTVGPITAPVDPVPVNTAINASANFTDPGILDTHIAAWDWGDGTFSPGVVTEINGYGSVTGSHTYSAPGAYTITLAVMDKDGGQGSSTFASVVVYNQKGCRWTGGGTIGSNRDPRVTHSFELHCSVDQLPNNLEVNWGGNHFHLDALTRVVCSDDPTINPRPPCAGCDTIHGWGIGQYNGVSGYKVEFIFTDAGEPGRNDWAWIKITASNGDTIMEVSGFLRSGNQQAHNC